jgi:hypothetical protein
MLFIIVNACSGGADSEIEVLFSDTDQRFVFLLVISAATTFLFIPIKAPYSWVDLFLVGAIWASCGSLAAVIYRFAADPTVERIGGPPLIAGDNLLFTLITLMLAPPVIGGLVSWCRRSADERDRWK